MDMDSLFKVLGTLSLSQLNQCSEHLEKIIRFKRQTATSLCVSDFVESHSDFVDKSSVDHPGCIFGIGSSDPPTSKVRS